MEDFREDFDTKSGEILAYLDLLKFLEGAGSVIQSSTTPQSTYIITAETRKTLKGAVYILLYNLVESTMREAICYIHDSLHDKNIEFDNLNSTLRKEIIRRIKSDAVGVDSVLSGLTKGISVSLSQSSFNKRKLFSGNIDRDEIESKSKIYGFSTNTIYAHTKHGEKLGTVRQHRNDLAHGNTSFSEIGKNVTYQDLEDVSLEIIAYLDSISANIDSYINSAKYLA